MQIPHYQRMGIRMCHQYLQEVAIDYAKPVRRAGEQLLTVPLPYLLLGLNATDCNFQP